VRYDSGAQMQHLKTFVLSEGARYQQLVLASHDVSTRRTANPLDEGLEGWTFLMRTPARDFALAYFELQAARAELTGFVPDARYRWRWFDPRNGVWLAELIVSADAGSRGAKVTCGISINNLALNENDIGEYRTFFKLYPPLRSEDDRMGMIEALEDGTIDIIVSSHDPQDVDTKRLPFGEAEDGAVGLETLLPAALRLYHSGQVSPMRLIDALSTRPAQIFGLPAGTLKPGAKADIALVDLDEPWLVAKDMLLSRSKNTPFEDARMSGRAVATYVAGKLVHSL